MKWMKQKWRSLKSILSRHFRAENCNTFVLRNFETSSEPVWVGKIHIFSYISKVLVFRRFKIQRKFLRFSTVQHNYIFKVLKYYKWTINVTQAFLHLEDFFKTNFRSYVLCLLSQHAHKMNKINECFAAYWGQMTESWHGKVSIKFHCKVCKRVPYTHTHALSFFFALIPL